MSKYLTFNDIVFTNRELLLDALKDCGFPRFETGTALPLFGYGGDTRPETADIVIRRKDTGVGGSNDIGFKKVANGYVPIISEYDQGAVRHGKFLPFLRAAYSERVIVEVKKRLHGTATREVKGSVIMVKVRF